MITPTLTNMIKTLKTLSLVYLMLLLSTTASAHSDTALSNISHSIFHILPSIGIVVVLLIAGFLLFNRQPKAKKVPVRIKK
ncbi:MAG: hypothetical protein V3U71_14190 [Cocleimonas sp.]